MREHLSTNAVANETSSGEHIKVSFRKWIPPESDNSRWVIFSVPLVKVHEEGFDDGRESVEWGEGGRRLAEVERMMIHIQVLDARKTLDPTISRDGLGAADEQRFGVTRRRG